MNIINTTMIINILGTIKRVVTGDGYSLGVPIPDKKPKNKAATVRLLKVFLYIA